VTACECEHVFRAPRVVTATWEVAVCLAPSAPGGSRPSSRRRPAWWAGTIALADDEVLCLGLVDTHVHVNPPGRTEWEAIRQRHPGRRRGSPRSPTWPLNSIPLTVDVAALEIKREAARARSTSNSGAGPSPATSASCAPRRRRVRLLLLHSGVDEFPHLGSRLDVPQLVPYGSVNTRCSR
jgi:allantoinase